MLTLPLVWKIGFTPVPDNLRTSIGKIVLSIFEKGIVIDKKWILEVAGMAPEPVLTYILKRAFNGDSQWLKDVAYKQVARLNTIPPDIAQGIRDAIIDLDDNNRLYQERYATKAHLSRVNRSVDFLSIMKLLLWLPRIDLGLNVLLFTLLLSVFTLESRIDLSIMLQILVLLLASHIFIRLKYMIPMKSKFSFFVLMRFYFYGIVFVIISTKIEQHIQLFILIICIIVFVFIYIIFAIKAAKTGLFVKMRWGALLSFWPIIYLFIFPRLAIVSFRKMMDALNLEDVTEFIVILLMIGIFSGIIILWSTVIKEHFPLLYLIGVIIFLIIMGVGLFRLLIKFVYNQVHDWIRWMGSHQKSFTCLELWETLKLYHTTGFRLRLVRLVREQRLLVATNEQKEFLRNVLSVVAAGTYSLSSTSSEKNETDKVITEIAFSVKRWDVAIFDELYQLLEDLMQSDKF